MVVGHQPVGAEVAVAALLKMAVEGLAAEAKPVAQLGVDIEPYFPELKGAAIGVTKKVIIIGVQIALAQKAMELDVVSEIKGPEGGRQQQTDQDSKAEDLCPYGYNMGKRHENSARFR
jgi:hypothetical protein